MTDGVKRTIVAQQAVDLGALLNHRFEGKHVGRDVPKRLSVVTLDSQSTSGGKLARQSIVLTPLEEGVQGTIMCGWLDVARRESELREHAIVSEQFEARYHFPFDVGVEEYDVLFSELAQILSGQGFRLLRVRANLTPRPVGYVDEGPEGQSSVGTILWIICGCLFGLGIAYFLR